MKTIFNNSSLKESITNLMLIQKKFLEEPTALQPTSFNDLKSIEVGNVTLYDNKFDGEELAVIVIRFKNCNLEFKNKHHLPILSLIDEVVRTLKEF